MSSVLLLDIGNSASKWMSFDPLHSVTQGRVDTGRIAEDLKRQLENATVLASCVAAPEIQRELFMKLAPLCNHVWFAQTRASLHGLINSYADPERMGVDRWLAMLGARQRTRSRVCVIDAGSALTIDLVASNGEHEGGYIIPGAALMEKALFADTDRVRDSAPDSVSIAPGRSTAEAVSHGVLLAQAGAVSLAIARARANGDAAQVLLCGGGARELTGVIDVDATSAPGLVLEGLLLQARLECPELLDHAALWDAYQAAASAVDNNF